MTAPAAPPPRPLVRFRDQYQEGQRIDDPEALRDVQQRGVTPTPEERDYALDALVGPNLSPADAAANRRAAERLGIDPDDVAVQPLLREEAERGRMMDALSAGPRIEAWLAERRSNAAVARPDLERLARAEVDWSAIAREALASDPNRGRNVAELRLEREARERRRGGWSLEAQRALERLQTEEGRAEAARSIRRMGENLQDPDWWRAQGQAMQRGTRQAWDNTVEFVQGLPEQFRDVRVQYGVSRRMQERADINWRIMMGQELPGDRERLAELRGIEEPEPQTFILGPMAQSFEMTWRGFLASARGGLETGLYGAAVGGGLAAAAGQAGPQAGLPEELVTVPGGAILGFRATAGAGALVGGGLQTMQTEGGLMYDELTDPNFVDENGQPLDAEVARTAALIVGAVNGGLEVVSLRALLRQLPGGDELLAGGSRAAVRARMRNLMRRRDFRSALARFGRGTLEVAATEAVTEFSQESVNVLGQRLAAAMDGSAGFPLPSHEEGFQRALQGGWFGFQAGLGFGGAAGGVRAATIDIPRAFDTNRDQLRLQALSEHIQSMQMRREAPGALEEALDRVTRNDAPEVYIDAQQLHRLFQSHEIDPLEAADAIPGLGREALAQAVEAGDVVAIPTSVVGSRLMGTPIWDRLADHARLTPDGLSPFELRRIRENEPELMRDVENMTREHERAGRQAEVYQQIEDALTRNLDAVGVTPGDANRVQARVFATIIMNMARAEGINPVALYEQFWSQIRGESDARASELTPGTPDFQALLERALEKQEQGLGLSVIEEWALERANVRGVGGETVGPLYQGDDEPIRAGPLPHRARVSLPPVSEARARVAPDLPALAPEQQARLRFLIAERQRLARAISDRIENERDLPEMVEARRDAEAMRALAYCAARNVSRRAAAIASVGGAVGGATALAGAATVAGAPSEIADGTLPPGATPEPPGDRRAVRIPIPPAAPPARLPAGNEEEAMAALPAERAATAELPEPVAEALAESETVAQPERAPETAADLPDRDLPIATNRRTPRQSNGQSEPQ